MGKGPLDSEEYSSGLIADGLVDGNIALWNPKPLIGKYKKSTDTNENAFAGNLTKHKGTIVAELPAGANWNFDVHWYSKIPGLISASSFDGKIGIYNIEFNKKNYCIEDIDDVRNEQI